MTQRQVEYFQAVCRKGNISAAAEELFVARSVVSRAIGELEAEFETQIFHRSKTGVTLTPSGELLAHFFQKISSSYDASKQRIRQLETKKEQKLCVGVTPTNAYCVFKVYLEEFQKRYPQIQLIVEEYGASSDSPWDMLLNGHLNLLFTPVPPDESLYEAMDLYENTTMLGVSTSSELCGRTSVSIGDLLELPLAFFNAPMPLERMLNDCFRALGRKPKVVLRTSDQMLLQELTGRGKVYTILPLDMMATWEHVWTIPLDFFHHSINRLVWSETLPLLDEMRLFLAFMREQTRNLA